VNEARPENCWTMSFSESVVLPRALCSDKWSATWKGHFNWFVSTIASHLAIAFTLWKRLLEVFKNHQALFALFAWKVRIVPLQVLPQWCCKVSLKCRVKLSILPCVQCLSCTMLTCFVSETTNPKRNFIASLQVLRCSPVISNHYIVELILLNFSKAWILATMIKQLHKKNAKMWDAFCHL